VVSPADRLPTGTTAVGEVVAHHRWGIDVRLLPPHGDVVGVVDVVRVTDELPFEPFRDYPPVGDRLNVVVLAYTPSGQLRLSARASDVNRAEAASRHSPPES
jgi:hypothetical protein